MTALVCALGCGVGEDVARLPNVVIVTLESLRTDHVGAYGGQSAARPDVPVTPRLDAFAEEAVIYEDAHAVTSWTLTSHASLLTGLYPSAHQAVGPLDTLDDSYPTLAELLAERGFQTAAVVSGPYLRRRHNLHQGFEIYDDSPAAITNVLAHGDVTNPRMEAALEHFLIEQRDPSRPFFLFAYFWDPHYDFLPPEPYDTMFVGPESEPFDATGFDGNGQIHPGMSPGRLAWLLAQYAGEIRWTDEHLGRFFDLLKREGLWDETLIIVTADHGEEFFDHGEKGHKNNVYAETVRVPLIVKYPGAESGRRDTRLVSHVDLVPTILDLIDSDVRVPLHGRSLLRPGPPDDRSIFYELLSVWQLRDAAGREFSSSQVWKGVRRGDVKLVWSEGDAPAEPVMDPADAGTSEPEGAAVSEPELDPALEPEAELVAEPSRAAEDASAGRLFHVDTDPTESEDRSAEERALVNELRRVFEKEMAAARRDASRYRPGPEARLDDEEIERLRALGYVGP